MCSGRNSRCIPQGIIKNKTSIIHNWAGFLCKIIMINDNGAIFVLWNRQINVVSSLLVQSYIMPNIFGRFYSSSTSKLIIEYWINENQFANIPLTPKTHLISTENYIRTANHAKLITVVHPTANHFTHGYFVLIAVRHEFPTITWISVSHLLAGVRALAYFRWTVCWDSSRLLHNKFILWHSCFCGVLFTRHTPLEWMVFWMRCTYRRWTMQQHS